MQPLDAGEPTVVGPYRLLGGSGPAGWAASIWGAARAAVPSP